MRATDCDAAYLHVMASRFAEAEAICSKILTADPTHPEALHLLGYIAVRKRNAPLAIELFKRALAVKPNFAQALMNLGIVLKGEGRLEEAIASYQKVIALKPKYAEAHKNLGIVLTKQGKMDEAINYFRKVESLGPGDGKNVAAFRISLLDEDKARKGEPYVKQLKDVLVDTAYWSILDGDKIYSRETHARSLFNNPFIMGHKNPDRTEVIAVYPDPEVVIKERCIFVGGDQIYSHWILRNLMKLSLIENNKDLQSLPLLLNADLVPYQSEALELLGISRDRQILVNRNSIIKCDNIHVPTLLRNHPKMKIGLDWLRRKFLSDQETTTRRNKDLIFVSRRDADRRFIVNEKDLAERLTELGFRTVVPGQMSFGEQVKTFSNASIVVGAHSAGLTNVVFAPLDCQMLEITSTTIEYMGSFRRICHELGQKVVSIVSNSLRPPSGEVDVEAMHYDFFVDVEEVVSVVSEMIMDPST